MARRGLKREVETCLRDYPETRNSDITLLIKVWELFYPQFVKTGSTGASGILFKDLYVAPREDNVKRVRAVFQNVQNKYLPTDWKVAKQRKINEEKWSEYIRNFNATN